MLNFLLFIVFLVLFAVATTLLYLWRKRTSLKLRIYFFSSPKMFSVIYGFLVATVFFTEVPMRIIDNIPKQVIHTSETVEIYRATDNKNTELFIQQETRDVLPYSAYIKEITPTNFNLLLASGYDEDIKYALYNKDLGVFDSILVYIKKEDAVGLDVSPVAKVSKIEKYKETTKKKVLFATVKETRTYLKFYFEKDER